MRSSISRLGPGVSDLENLKIDSIEHPEVHVILILNTLRLVFTGDSSNIQ